MGKRSGALIPSAKLVLYALPCEGDIDWIGKEVTGDPRYFNSNLIKNPYTKW